jgi:hypothetical protein
MKRQLSCFVIMPIGDPKKDPLKFKRFSDIYENIIKPSVEAIAVQLGITIKCARADDIKKSGSVMKQVLLSLLDDDILIADLSDRNANVFYELGIRHTFFKRSILISDDPSNNPFDVLGYRTIPYQYPECDMEQFQRELLGHISDLINNPKEPDNPIWDLNLKAELKDSTSKAKIEVGYKKTKITGQRHDYEFEFGVTNQGSVIFKDIVAEVKFPAEYLERKDWQYPHLHSSIVMENGMEYVHFTFNYMGIREHIRQSTYDMCLLPGKTIWIFGKTPLITSLPYFVVHDNWQNRRKYRVEWKVFIDGKIFGDGSVPFESLQMF